MIEINGKKIYFPIRYEPRKQQLSALEFLKKSILTGKKYSLLNLSTGTGKSFLSVAMFANWYKNYINNDASFDIITNSKVLQNQYIRDFDFIKNYKGMSNYYCDQFDCQCDVGKEICSLLKKMCNDCPYDKAKNSWISSEIGLTNFHLFNTLSLYQQDILNRRNSNVLIIDEAHDMESVYSDYLSSKLSARTLKKCGFTLKEVENLDNNYISKIKYLNNYISFLEKKLIPMLKNYKTRFETEIGNRISNKRKSEITKQLKAINGKLSAYDHLFESYKKDPENIVLDINKNKSEKMYSGFELITQHVWVYEYINDNIWKHYDHIIFMSASILDKKMFSFLNGLEEELTSYYELPSPFSIKNRKIYYIKVGKMSWKNKEETFKKQVEWIKKIMKKYKDKKGIIHTTNYEITDWLKENVMDERFIFHDSENRNEMLEKHVNSSKPTVLVSPSMMSGVDLKDDLARFQILLKIPYPSIASNKIKKRQKTNNNWYIWKTVVDTLQMYGRSTRSETDYSDTFILDSNFSDLLKYNSHIIPKYVTDAIKTLKI